MSSKKEGSPEGSKDFVVRARVDSGTIDQLDYCVEKLGSSRSEVIRQGINDVFVALIKKE